jgi:hypothetical protein
LLPRLLPLIARAKGRNVGRLPPIHALYRARADATSSRTT